jgi:hypothetical protein
MAHTGNSEAVPGQSLVYQIRITDHLGRVFIDWFEGLTITALDNGETLLTGPVVDRAVLYGLLEISARSWLALARGLIV